MPYICNIDFVAFSAYGIPYYRNEVIGYGDEKCANLFKIKVLCQECFGGLRFFRIKNEVVMIAR